MNSPQTVLLSTPHLTPLSLLPCPLPLPSSAYSCPTSVSIIVTFNSKPSLHPFYLNKVVSSQHLYGCWKKRQYLARWKDYSPAHDSWVNKEDLYTPELIENFKNQQSASIRTMGTTNQRYGPTTSFHSHLSVLLRWSCHPLLQHWERGNHWNMYHHHHPLVQQHPCPPNYLLPH